MAEGLTDDELQTVVDAYKKVQLERSQSEVQKEREERWELVIFNYKELIDEFRFPDPTNPITNVDYLDVDIDPAGRCTDRCCTHICILYTGL